MYYHKQIEPFYFKPKVRHYLETHTACYSLSIRNPRNLVASFSFCEPYESFSRKKGFLKAVQRYRLLDARLGVSQDVYENIPKYTGFGFSSIPVKYKEILKDMAKDRNVITNVPYTLIIPIEYFVRFMEPDLIKFSEKDLMRLDYTIFTKKFIEDFLGLFTPKFFSFMTSRKQK